MTSQCTAQLLADLGVTRSLSRPQVSDDNPFSEAQFKTLKYHPSFPGRFEDQGQAKTFCRSFLRWYNAEHRHGGISMLTPEQVHFGNADQVIAGREAVLREAWAAHPDRFVSGEPKPKPLPEAVWINPPTPSNRSAAKISSGCLLGPVNHRGPASAQSPPRTPRRPPDPPPPIPKRMFRISGKKPCKPLVEFTTCRFLPEGCRDLPSLEAQ